MVALPQDLDLPLSPEQERVLRLVEKGKSVFFTGPAGTGKSLLLRRIIWRLAQKFERKTHLGITATTGVAALHIGGTTLHSFAGIGLGKEPAKDLAKRIVKSRKLAIRWRYLEALVIDEVSMLDGDLFDKLEEIARIVRNNDYPFGGIQLIISGDFFQLPPVPDKSYRYTRGPLFAFEANSWAQCVSHPVFLHKVFRQIDQDFIRLLTNIRHGTLVVDDYTTIEELERPRIYEDGIEPSQLFPRREEVDRCNSERLAALPAPEYIYSAMDRAGVDVDGYPIPHDSARLLLERLVAPTAVALRVGALVMLVQNMPQEGGDPSKQLVNGSQGSISRFLSVREARDQDIEITTNRPGSSLNKDEGDPSSISPEEDEQPLSGHMFEKNKVYPVVRFTNGRECLCVPTHFTVVGYRGNVEARRIQVPLILAWAISVHKSQGQTLERVKVDLERTFEKGQVYVALSRAKSIKGLEMINFHPNKIHVSAIVQDWYSDIIARQREMNKTQSSDEEE